MIRTMQGGSLAPRDEGAGGIIAEGGRSLVAESLAVLGGLKLAARLSLSSRVVLAHQLISLFLDIQALSRRLNVISFIFFLTEISSFLCGCVMMLCFLVRAVGRCRKSGFISVQVL